MVTEVNSVSAIGVGNVLVDFYTKSCAPCRAMNPILNEISEEYDNVEVAKVDVALNPEVSQMFGVMSVPTIIFMKNRKVRETLRGLANKKALVTMINNCIND